MIMAIAVAVAMRDCREDGRWLNVTVTIVIAMVMSLELRLGH